MGSLAAANLFRFLVFVLISRFALVGSDDRAHVSTRSLPSPQNRIVAGERLHPQSVFRTVSAPGRNIEFEQPMKGPPRGGEGVLRESAVPSQPLNIRFFARKM